MANYSIPEIFIFGKTIIMKSLLLFTLLLPFCLTAQKIEKVLTSDFLFSEAIKQNTNPLAFRFVNARQFIDITVDTDSLVSGSIINFTWPCPNKDCTILDWSKAKMYRQTIVLSSVEANAVFNLIKQYNILEIQSGIDIEDWPVILDGYGLDVYQNLNGEYKEKSYSNPSEVTGIKEAEQIDAFDNELNKLLQLRERHSKFLKTIGSGDYTQGDYLISIRRKHWWQFWK